MACPAIIRPDDMLGFLDFGEPDETKEIYRRTDHSDITGGPIGAASPYLAPIGHQSNTLVLGPGDYKFGDYWRLGLPMDLVIIAVSVPMIIFVWM